MSRNEVVLPFENTGIRCPNRTETPPTPKAQAVETIAMTHLELVSSEIPTTSTVHE